MMIMKIDSKIILLVVLLLIPNSCSLPEILDDIGTQKTVPIFDRCRTNKDLENNYSRQICHTFPLKISNNEIFKKVILS